MAEQATSESSPDTDRDFDPTAEMLIHDYDDEQTLDEEEALSNGESVVNELAALQAESEMPMEELLVLYGYGREADEARDFATSSSVGNDANANSEEEAIGPAAAAATAAQPIEVDGTNQEMLDNSDPDRSNSEQESSAHSQMARLLSADLIEASTDEDEEEDEDYDPDNDEDWKKTVQIGNDYQAIVPEGLESYGDAPVYEGEDRLLWDPKTLNGSEIEKYLEEVQMHNMSNAQGVYAVPAGSHVRDDEQALYLLLNCDHNLDEAVRRHKMQSVPASDPMSLWSEEECRNFELGLRAYGKDFFLNQQNKVRTRSVKEIVQFYYLWKKTERHDAFAARTRLEKKKYALHPGITDYMDRFLDEHENLSEMQEPLTSPNIRSLLYGDPKRQEGRSSEDLTAALEIVQRVANSSTVDLLLPEKFREDVQAMVLDSLVTSSDVEAKPEEFAGSVCLMENVGGERSLPPNDYVQNAAPRVSMQEGRTAEDKALSAVLPLRGDVHPAETVLEVEPGESEGLPPPLKRPRMASPSEDEFSVSGNSQKAVLSSLESCCLSATFEQINRTLSSLTTTTTLSSSSSLGRVPPDTASSGCCIFSSGSRGSSSSVISVGSETFASNPALGADVSVLGSLCSVNSSVSLPFDSFNASSKSLCIALEPSLVGIENITPMEEMDSLNPGLQRLTSLDSIEPSLPAFDAAIDTYASVLNVPGNALENMTMDVPGNALESMTMDVPGNALESMTLDVPGNALESMTMDVPGNALENMTMDVPGNALESMTMDGLTSVLDGFNPEDTNCATVSVATSSTIVSPESAVTGSDAETNVRISTRENIPSKDVTLEAIIPPDLGTGQGSAEITSGDDPVSSCAETVHSVVSESISGQDVCSGHSAENADSHSNTISGNVETSAVETVAILTSSEQNTSPPALPEKMETEDAYSDGDGLRIGSSNADSVRAMPCDESESKEASDAKLILLSGADNTDAANNDSDCISEEGATAPVEHTTNTLSA